MSKTILYGKSLILLSAMVLSIFVVCEGQKPDRTREVKTEPSQEFPRPPASVLPQPLVDPEIIETLRHSADLEFEAEKAANKGNYILAESLYIAAERVLLNSPLASQKHAYERSEYLMILYNIIIEFYAQINRYREAARYCDKFLREADVIYGRAANQTSHPVWYIDPNDIIDYKIRYLYIYRKANDDDRVKTLLREVSNEMNGAQDDR